MNRLQAARAAMVALSAVGMIWATPALAASYEAVASTVHVIQDPNEPTTTPNVPGPGTILQAKPADLDVTYISQAGGNGSFQWTFEVRNVGQKTATNVKVMKNAVRNDFHGHIETDIEFQTLGDIGAGAAKTVVVSCAPKWQQPPCSSSSVSMSPPNNDPNPGNDWDLLPTNYP